MEQNLSLLLVEDNAKECSEIINYVDSLDDTYLIGVTNNTSKALSIIKEKNPDAIILDLELLNGLGNGLTLLQDLQNLSLLHMPYILITTNNSSNITHKSARGFGADFIMPKYKDDYSAKTVVDFLRMMKNIIQSNKVSQQNTADCYDTFEQNEKMLSRKICRELDLIGISTKASGYRYLVDAISIVIKAPCKNLCHIIGEKYGKTNFSVERAMQNAIQKAWRTTAIDDLLNLYTAKINSERGVPTITEFIYYYANKIKNQQEVL